MLNNDINISNLKDTPYLSVLTGPMFSGKSMEISRRLTNIYYYNKHNPDKEVKFIIVRPSIDTRDEKIRPVPYDKFNQMTINRIISDREEIHLESELMSYDMIVFDEAQFFTGHIKRLVKFLLSKNKYILISGLDKDYRGEPFSEFMQWVLCVADDVTKLTAICAKCGKPSTAAKLICTDGSDSKSSGNIFIEDENHKYVPMCRKCMMSDKE